jgi:hypothetical protein
VGVEQRIEPSHAGEVIRRPVAEGREPLRMILIACAS